LEKAARELYSALFAELDMNALFGDDEEKREYFWSKEQRAEITATIVRQALALLEWLEPRLEQLPDKKACREARHVLRLVRQLQKILKDDFTIKFDDKTGELSIKQRLICERARGFCESAFCEGARGAFGGRFLI
jgi:hypothetical protein